MMKLFKLQFIIIGIISSFLACSMLGYLASQKAYFKHFKRFYDANSPFRYFPTASELLNTAQKNLDPNKVIILVGGSSIFRGAAQNANELWSDALQKKLGNAYQVLNFANNTASIAAGAGVAFRMLIERYPKIIYVATYTLEADSLEGNLFFKYLFWDAYYKSLFHPDAIEKNVIQERRQQELKSWRGKKMHALAYLDSWLYFKSFWNWIDYHYITTGVDTIPGLHIKAKKYYLDPMVNLAQAKKALETNKELIASLEQQLKNIRQTIPAILDESHRHLISIFRDSIRLSYQNLFSPRYRSKIVLVWIPFNPKYIQTLRGVTESYNVIADDLSSIVKELGYHPITINNLTANDFPDLVHLLASGGRTVANDIAPHVVEVAQTNQYLDVKKPRK